MWKFVVSVTAFMSFALIVLPARAHDVKDPVCRMTVDSDTTPFQQTVDGNTYYFCSTACEDKFKKAPAYYVALDQKLAANGGPGYKVTLATVDPQPRQPVPMTIAVTNGKDLVRNFEVIHEKLMHLILVRSDLSWFEHQHPVLEADGLFHFTWTFPAAGRYYLYADFTPVGGDNQIKQMVLDVGKFPAPCKASLQPGLLTPRKVDDTHISLKVDPARFVCGQQTLMTYRFTDLDGKPVTDMQPFIGAMGHMIAIREDGGKVVHVHVLHGVAPGSYAAAMLPIMQAGHALVVTPEMVTLTGPEFTFKLTLPTDGVYKIWAQFMRHNRVVTVPFVVRSLPSPSQ